MPRLPLRFSALLIAAALQSTGWLMGLPARAASALAAWSLGRDGVLQLRTATGARLDAFFEAGDRRQGPRVWIDFPGELSRPRRILGSGPVREIRLGKPTPGATRLVIEFQQGVTLDPGNLRLVGTAPDRWKLMFEGLPTQGLRAIGEGDLNRASTGRWGGVRIRPTQTPVNAAGLPEVARGRYRVVVDPGHGGPDPGAVGINGIREAEIVLDISLQVARLLEAKGVQVTLTRTAEVDVDLPPRVSLANRIGATAFVSIHANAISMSRPDVNGIETFYFSDPRSARLAAHIQQQVLNVSPGSPNRGVRRGRFFVIRRTTMPAALVETGFVTGNIDSPRLATASHRRRLALAIAAGILEYLQGVR
ncbi:N-acetylmuramoyl-L-alanine amidase [Synechococcus sp. W2B2]|uniref:N-acetylmuramoyl-L-alanine amidase n=1 Tax=unclassified Synechococcus TaxID=2626047 RepID=UPI00006B0C62|nr:N-acetylmuramoyl-L-alanine amidase [Synechococcus sp. WH 7805]EAR18550.1 Cell wall hydrolase/autolysin [Synechococcus sp. WH 7805]